MPAELSESAARALLDRAAATIDVDPAIPPALTTLPGPRPRHWPAMVAAAAAVLLVVTGAVLISHHHARTPHATYTGHVVEHAYRYGPGRMPSLFGYTGTEAQRLLEARGMTVQVRTKPTTCDVAGQVLRTEPVPGTPVKQGSAALLWVARTRLPVASCRRGVTPDWQTVWGLIRYARGIGPAPQFAGHVTATVYDPSTGKSTTRLTAAEATRPGSWTVCAAGVCHSALEGVARMVTAPPPTLDGAPAATFVQARYYLPCAHEPADDGALRFWMEIPTDGRFCPTSQVAITQDGEGRIVGVTYYAPPAPTARPSSAIADAARVAAARNFIAWARGAAKPPVFARRVRATLAGHRLMAVPRGIITPAERGSWSWCMGFQISPRCTVGPLAAIRRQSAVLMVRGARSRCEGQGTLPAGKGAGPDLVIITTRSPCPRMEVDLWISAKGRIRALNLVPRHRRH